MSLDTATSYELIPYTSNPFPETHPDSLATVATLFGMTPPRVDRCRVLELGCARGGNLIPMAVALPDTRFLGIDQSPSQVADGHRVIETLGLPNIEMSAKSILEVDASFGRFDYIICHGVYSWVPAEVQDKILAICSENLAPSGVAYVSFNTYPGWHMKGMIREMMGFYVQNYSDPQVRIEKARAFLDILVNSVWDPSGVYARYLREESDRLRKNVDAYLFHEYLEEVNQPVYFHQFVERAGEKGLKYLGDARFNSMAANVAAALRTTLEGLSTEPLLQEQYLDFLRSRAFRRTLLCHDQVAISSAPVPEAVEKLQAITLLAPVSSQPDVSSNATEAFRNAQGATVSIDLPLVKASLLVLSEHWPRPVPFEVLRASVHAKLSQSASTNSALLGGDARKLGDALLLAYASSWLELHVHVPPYVRDISERPVASRLARYQAESSKRVVSLRHRLVDLARIDQHVLRLLDGRRDRAALLTAVEGLVADGSLEIRGEKPRDPAQVRAVVSSSVEQSLIRIASCALLVG